jgi:ATP-dependent protease HslVU (ClpYQ) ATPase subunit
MLLSDLSFKQRQVLSLVSGCLIHTMYGAVYTLGTITPYIASHIYYSTDSSIKVVDVSINYPV